MSSPPLVFWEPRSGRGGTIEKSVTSLSPVRSALPTCRTFLCHIPAGAPDDFAASTEPLTLYCLFRTRPS
jgi:hypothetical protein